jgi:hypothetical protein
MAIGFSPLAAIFSPHWWPVFLPGGGHEAPHGSGGWWAGGHDAPQPRAWWLGQGFDSFAVGCLREAVAV